MALGNLFLGDAGGKLGSVVFFRKNSKQVSRVRVTEVSNPRTNAQYISRISVSELSRAYSLLQNICNHSFQGRAGKAKNQARFLQKNLPLLKNSALGLEENKFDWLTKDQLKSAAILGPLFISEGTINSLVKVKVSSDDFLGIPIGIEGSLETYSDFAKYWGVNIGDQITFVCLDENSTDFGFDGVRLSRIILEPSSGSASETSFLAKSGNFYTVNLPNSRNMGNIQFKLDELSGTSIGESLLCPYIDNSYALNGLGVIVSRKSSSGVWLRSTSQIVCHASQSLHSYASVVDSFKKSTVSVASSKYLNNATD